MFHTILARREESVFHRHDLRMKGTTHSSLYNQGILKDQISGKEGDHHWLFPDCVPGLHVNPHPSNDKSWCPHQDYYPSSAA
jgi:hypothetical protein